MQKRDKFGHFIKSKVVKKKTKKPKKLAKKVTVCKPQKKVTNVFALDDLNKLIATEVARQLRDSW